MCLDKYKLNHLFLLILFPLYWVPVSFSFGQSSDSGKEKFSKRIIAKGLNDPWTILYGPDNHLWVTESKAYKVLRVNPENGSIETLLDLNSERQFPHYDSLQKKENNIPWPQGGLMGMALHPQFQKDKPFVYLAFVYAFEGGGERDKNLKGFHFRTKIVRYTYNKGNKSLGVPLTVCDTIPGSDDHNGGRLLISEVEGENYLFYSAGDMGAGQYDNAGRPNHAQDIKYYEGKILRFSLEPANAGGKGPDWIPEDNPFNNGGKNAVWSFGHRNPQGLTAMRFKGKEKLYSSEHGPFSDDEINIIEKGANYGHPLIIGYADGNYNGLSAGATEMDSLPGKWNTTYPFIKSEQENAKKLKNYKDPLLSFNPTGRSRLQEVAEKIRSAGEEKPEWESIAPSGITSYQYKVIPSWNNSLLITSLKQGSIFIVKLNSKGNKVTGRREYFKGNNRYRDAAVSSDGIKIYLVTDKSSATSGPTEEDPDSTEEEGAIIEYSYQKE